ncbi:MAG TPA: SDR family NAD(P)-dependent oxidoreductase, partial [Bacteroidetes bacterium]|nr:SDR family NAD(P)-dependent oxidoreductase [Bacteroidota bacterium]
MKNILITGGAGFIGQRLAARLLEKGYAVTLLDNLSEQIHGKISVSEIKEKLPEGSSFIYGDVLNKQLLKELIVSHNYLIHLAAETGTGQSMYEIEHYVNVNINATAAIMDILTNEKHSMEKVLVASSRAIYGEGKYSCRKHGVVYPDHRLESDLINGDFNVKCPQCHENVDLLPTDEQSKIHPSSIYGITKQVQEQLVMVTGKAIGLPVCALRYQNVYGPGQSLKNPYTGILSIFSTRIFNNNSIN